MNDPQYNEWAKLAESRSKNYWFLARFYLERPESCFLSDLSSSITASMESEANASLMQMSDEIRRIQGDGTASTALGVEYTRLFRGIEEGYGPPPPYESVYRENRLMGDSTMDVMRHYQASGFGIIDETAGPQDHLGVELKFMSLLCFNEHEAWSKDDMTGAIQIIQRQRSFLKEHLMAWVPAYCDRIMEESRQAYYSSVAKLTLDTIRAELSLLDELSRELDAA